MLAREIFQKFPNRTFKTFSRHSMFYLYDFGNWMTWNCFKRMIAKLFRDWMGRNMFYTYEFLHIKVSLASKMFYFMDNSLYDSLFQTLLFTITMIGSEMILKFQKNVEILDFLKCHHEPWCWNEGWISFKQNWIFILEIK